MPSFADELVEQIVPEDTLENELDPEHQLILDAIVDGICGLNTDGTITFCNDALLQMTGYARQEVVGQNAHDLLHHSRPDGTKVPRPECDLGKGVRQGEAARVVGGLLWRKNGTYLPVEYWRRPVQASGGRTSYIAMMKDISEIEITKEALRKSEEQYRRILESMPDVAWTSDVKGRTRYVSPKVSALLGFTNQEIYAGGTHLWLNQIHPEDFSRVSQRYRDLFEMQVGFNEEYRIGRKDGTWIWVHDRATRTHDKEGVLCADGFISDITQRKQAEADLRSKTAFLEAQAHSTIDGVLVVDQFGRRLMVNERFAELWEIPTELLTDPDDRRMLDYVMTLVKAAETPSEQRLTIYTVIRRKRAATKSS